VAADTEGSQIVRRALASEDRNSKLSRNYTFLERIENERLDSSGRVRSREVKTYDITLLEGSPYRRWIGRDDRPLPPHEEKKQQDRLQKSIEERRRETAAQRAKRLAEYEKKREARRNMQREVIDAFDFRLAGEEMLDGWRLWVLEATPRPGYRPRAKDVKIFRKLRGRLWIDQQHYQVVKLEAEVMDTISLGFLLARLSTGSRMMAEWTRVNEEVWLPKQVHVAAAARVALVKKFRIAQRVSYSNYRKFETDSRVVSISEVP
jgi:hypothetical protein